MNFLFKIAMVVCISVNAYSSSFEALLTFPMKECYPNDVSAPQAPVALSQQELDLYAQSKGQYTSKESLAALRNLSLRGHIASMYEMGNACLERKKFNLKYSEALRWFVMAFQKEYLLEGQNSQASRDYLMGLMKGPGAQKDKDVKSFSKSYVLFLSCHPEGKHKEEDTFLVLREAYVTQKGYKDALIENHLSQNEKAIKADYFKFYYLNSYASVLDLMDEAVCCRDRKEYASAFYYMKKVNTPYSLSAAASLCVGGLVRKENGDYDYQQAEQLCLIAGTPSALFNLGWMYNMGKIGVVDGRNDYISASKYYEQSQLPDALCNLGNLYRSGHVGLRDGVPDYEKARELYLQSNNPHSLWNLGRLYRNGAFGEKDYEQAAKYFTMANHEESLIDLGSLYYFGHIGLKDGRPDMVMAAKCFEESKCSLGYFRLGSMCLSGFIHLKDGRANYQRGLIYLNLSTFHRAQSLKLVVIEDKYYDFKEVAPFFKTEDPGVAMANQCALIAASLDQLEPVDQKYYLGLLSYFRDRNYTAAIMHFQEAMDLGCLDSYNHILKINLVIEMIEKHEQRRKNQAFIQRTIVFPVPEPSISDEVTTSDESSSEEIVPLKVMDKTPDVPERIKPAKVVLSYADKMKKLLAKANKRIISSGNPGISRNEDDKKEVVPLKTVFLNEDVKKDFNSLDTPKLKELMDHINNKPHGTEGAGKPEVLKNKFAGHKGCISRRIDEENRLVYKVTGTREILILSCRGHYK